MLNNSRSTKQTIELTIEKSRYFRF